MGDGHYLAVAEKAAAFYLRAQQKRGHWLKYYLVEPSGRVLPAFDPDIVRLQDKFQTIPFLFMVMMYRVTRESRYLDSARRNADLVLSLQNENGSWPALYDLERRAGWTGSMSTHGGARDGGEYNDFSTTDPMRMMILMYHVTGDPKYVRGLKKTGQWIFDTQIGEGKVRGWCQQYDKHNRPAWGRPFEGPVISPRVLTWFVGPMCRTFHLITGEDRYVDLMKEAAAWYRSVEVPGPKGGWYYQYLADGTPCYAWDRKIFTIDPRHPEKTPAFRRHPAHGALKRLFVIEDWLKKRDELGKEAFHKSYTGKVELTPEEVARIRIREAHHARKCARVPQTLAELEGQHASGFWLRKLKDGGSRALEGSAAPRPWVWKFVEAERTARGKVPVSALVKGGKGPWYYESVWYARGEWYAEHVWHVEDWYDVPLEGGGSREKKPGSVDIRADGAHGEAAAPDGAPPGWKLAFADTFERRGLGADWKVLGGTWQIQNGWLTGLGTNAEIVCLKPGPGNQRLEYDCRAGNGACDLSAILMSNTEGLRHGYFFGFGTAQNSHSRLLIKGVPEKEYDGVITPGKTHHVVCQVEDGTLTHLVDGRTLLKYVIPEASEHPLRGPDHQMFGLYIFSTGEIDNVRLYTKPHAESVGK